jgi:pimeloyl-ACP methyl ester carboxylesterase
MTAAHELADRFRRAVHHEHHEGDPSPMSAPTIVLVHGAFADASSWTRLYAELRNDGATVLAPANPLRGVTAGDADYTKQIIGQIDGPVLLVGHSYGGAVITAAGTADNVVGLVYVNGFAPDEGEDLGSLQAQFPVPVAGPFITPGDLPGGGQEFHIAANGFHEAFCADLAAEEADFMANSQRPLSGVAFGEKAAVAAWHSRPTWAVIGNADGAIHPDVHRFCYDRMGATTTEVEGASHCVMLSQPKVVADVVRSASNVLV